MLIFCALCLALVPLFAAMGYSDLLRNCLNNNVTFTITQGGFSYNPPGERKMMKRNGVMITDLHDTLGKLPDLKFYSFDNSQVLESLKIAATKAYRYGNFGDFFYFWGVMNHNGHPSQVNDPSILASEVAKRLGNVPQISEILANTLTITSLAEKYKAMDQGEFGKEVFKRDTTICSNSNWPKIADCNQLMFDIRRGLAHQYDISKCYYTCCAAWSKQMYISTAWVKEKVQWCQELCVYNGYSCKIVGMKVYGKKFNFCTSSVSRCD